MPALRPRTAFAASFVMTVAACSKTDGGGAPSDPPPAQKRDEFSATWSVSRHSPPGDPAESCLAMPHVGCPPGMGTMCNPPSPQPIACPPGADRGVMIAKKTQTDPACYLVPDDCSQPSCATQKVRCPWSYQELGLVLRTGKRDPGGFCTSSWLPEEYVTGQFVVPCPGDGITAFTITRADLDKPCVLSAPGIAGREIPCPAEPAQFANAAALKAALAANQAALVGKRVQITATRGTVSEVGCGRKPSNDQIRVAVDARVTARGTLEDCAIWDY